MKPSTSYYKQEVDKAIAAIKFLKTHKPAKTPEEKQLLLGFCGGGVLKEAGIFTDSDKPRWLVEKREELRSLINRDEWVSLQNAGMLNAHYTKREIATEIWRFVASFLKPGDKVLDPGCGTARFYPDCPPGVKYIGVDNEPLSVAIAKAAHQGTSIYCKDFLQWKYPQEFQAVIGNIPFVNGVKTYYLENQKLTLGLHAQFFCKSIFHLQEGGVLALLTSINALDAKGEDYVAFRRWVDKQCHFLGAVRLPLGAVHDGGTEVTTDLILLQKRKLGDKTPNPNWIETVGTGLSKQYMEKSEEIRINQWYADRSHFVLGELGFDPLTQGKRSAAIAREAQDVISDLKEALAKISNKEIEAMNSAETQNWEAFEARFVDKKGEKPGDAAVQMWFPEKPPEKVTEMLKKVGFRFHGNGVQYWYAYLPGEVTPEMEAKGVKTLEAFVRGLVKSYAPKGAVISQEKPKPEAPTTQTPAPGGGMLRMLKEMAEDLKALRSEVAEIKERSVNSGELEKLKAQHEAELSKFDNLNLRLGEKVHELQVELQKKQEVIDSQKLTIEASVMKINELEQQLKEQVLSVVHHKELLGAATAEIDRISTRYDTLVKSLNDQGFTVEDFLSEAPQEEVVVSFDDTPAISFDSDESEPEEAESLDDDAGDDRDGADTPPSGDAADSGGFDFEELDEVAEEEGFDPGLMDDLGK